MQKFKVFAVLTAMLFVVAACTTDSNGDDEDPLPDGQGELSIEPSSIDNAFSVTAFDIGDLRLLFEDEAGDVITIIPDASMIISEIPDSPGEHTITVEYRGVETSFEVTLIDQINYQLQTLYDMGISEGLIDADSYEDWLETITGEDGRGIDSLDIDNRELIVTFDDGDQTSLGIIVPEDPRSIVATDFSDSILTISYDDGTEDTFMIDMPSEGETITDTRITAEGYLEVTYADGTQETLGRVTAREVEFDVSNDTLRWRYSDEETWHDLYALNDWIQDDEYVTITLKYLDDYVFDEFQIRRGESFVKDAPSMVGFMFNGWAADRDGSERVDAKTPVYDDVTLYANFRPDETHQYINYHSSVPHYLPIESSNGYASFDATNYHSASTLIIPNQVMNEAGQWVPLSVIEAEAFKNNDNLETVHVLSEDHIEFESSAFEGADKLESVIFEYPEHLGVVLHEKVFKDTVSLGDMVFPTDTALGYQRFISDEEAVIAETLDFVDDELHLFLSDGSAYNLEISEAELEAMYEDYDIVVSTFEGNQFIITLQNEDEDPEVMTYTIEGLQEAGTQTFYAYKLFQNSGITSFTIEGEYGDFDTLNNALINEVPYRAFDGAANLETFRVPQPNADIGVVEDSTLMIWRDIGDYAFAGTISLVEFDFDRFTTLGAYAFAQSGLSEANFHLDPFNREGVFRHIDLSNAQYAFKGSDIEFVSFNDGQTSVPEGFFMNTGSLESIEIPIETLTGGFEEDAEASLTRFEARAFKNSNISKIEFPTRGRETLTFEDITYFGEESLAGTQFKTIELHDDATVKSGAFRGIEPLETFIWNGNTATMPAYLLADTPNLETVELPERVIELKEGFLYNSGIQQFTVSGHIQTIGDAVFKGSQLSDIEFDKVDNYLVDEGEASMLQSIGESAFAHTPNLESIVLPAVFHPTGDYHILDVGDYAFKDSGLISFESQHDHMQFGRGAFEATRDLETFIWFGQAEAIADRMFAGATSLESLEMPETIEFIGESAFVNTAIETFELPSSIKEIGDRAFESTPLQTFVFPDDTQLTHIGSHAFRQVEASFSIEFPDTLESLGRGVFQGSNVTAVHFNEALIETIPTATFLSAEHLEYVQLSKQTEVIEDGAFRNTYALKDFVVGVEADSFDRSTSFELPQPHNLSIIKRGAFINSGLEYLELPPSVEIIEAYAFRTSELQTIILSEALHTLESNAFTGTHDLENVVFNGDNLETLEGGVFRHTLSLDALTLPPSITTIEADAFEDTHLEFLRLSPKHLGDLELFIDDLETLRELRFTPTVEVPDDQSTFPAIFEFNDTIEVVDVPSGITHMERETFRGAYSLRRVFLPSTLESIPQAAFAFTHDLELVTPGSGLQSIERDAFFSSGINDFELPDSVEFIGRHAFRNTENLTTLNHDPQVSALEIIESGAFRGSGLESFVIPEATHAIETQAFAETAALTELIIPNTLEYVGPYLLEDSGVETVVYEHMSEILPEGIFYNAANLENVDFTDNPVVESFGAYAFSGTESITEFTLPESMIETGEKAFKDHPTLERIYLNADLESISASTFEGASTLFEVDVPDQNDADAHALTHIGEAAFKDTESLSFFFVGENLEVIEDYAFENSNFNPAPANLPSSLRLVGDYAFSGSNITDFEVTEYLLSIGESAFESSALSTLTFSETHDVYDDYEGAIPEESEGFMIGDSAFRNTDIETLELPYYVMIIGESAFRDTEMLESVDTTNANNLFIIDAHAFRNTPALTNFDLPNTLVYLGDYAFAETGEFDTFTIPALQSVPEESDGEISQLGEGILYDSAVRNVVLRGTVNQVPAYAFAYMSNFESIEIVRAEHVNAIGTAAFYKTTGLDELPDLENLHTVGARAFEGTQLETFSFSSAIGLIDEAAFKNTPLTSVDFTLENETSDSDGLVIEAEAFYGTSITTFEAPESLIYIGGMSFANSALEVLYLQSTTEQVYLSEQFTRIGDRSDPFLDSNLLGIIVEESVYHLYEQDRHWNPYFDIIEYE